MASERVLVDAGPLVALLNENDIAHAACSAEIIAVRMPLLSSWAVLAEAAWLLRNIPGGCQRMMRLLSDGIVVCPALDSVAALWIESCEKRYADLMPQLADMTLLFLAEQENINTIFTLDRRDFTVYRDSRKQAFRLIPETAVLG